MSDDEIPPPATPAADLSLFQRVILLILAEEPRYGLAIKEALTNYYGEDINHGRMYTNLDQLAEMGYVLKGQLDKRTNLYSLTEEGHEVLQSDLAWRLDSIGTTEAGRDRIEVHLSQYEED